MLLFFLEFSQRMNKAFIFDMDGVLVASEKLWHEHLQKVWPNLVGPEIANVFRIPIGQTPLTLHAEAIKHGSTVTLSDFLTELDKIANEIYKEAPITNDFEKLVNFLAENHFGLGLVSSSKRAWIDLVLERVPFRDKISSVVSINDTPELQPKPHPGSYIETIANLDAKSDTTIVLEDSNSGIQAAKSAGVFTIGFTPHLLPEYTQHGADVYANTIEDVIEIVKQFDSQLV